MAGSIDQVDTRWSAAMNTQNSPSGGSTWPVVPVEPSESVPDGPVVSAEVGPAVESLGPVVPGPYVLRAHADGFLPSPPVALTVEGPGTALQVLTLAEPGRIEGRVVDEDGFAVEDARVELLAEHLFTAGEGQTRARFAQAALRAAGSLGVTTGPVPEVPVGDETQADLGTSVLAGDGGRFSFDMLVPGHYRLQASHGHYAQSDEARVRLGAGGTRAGVTLVLRTGHGLTGREREGGDRPGRDARRRFADRRWAATSRAGAGDRNACR
ncbi:MAG: carboxypeptidase regulatory-like domain-containing protein, partial [Myxococcales bacterium]|nr:carboxypeptidase regulatory-like domain-containing protein [Myxococcales bacterium]